MVNILLVDGRTFCYRDDEQITVVRWKDEIELMDEKGCYSQAAVATLVGKAGFVSAGSYLVLEETRELAKIEAISKRYDPQQRSTRRAQKKRATKNG